MDNNENNSNKQDLLMTALLKCAEREKEFESKYVEREKAIESKCVSFPEKDYPPVLKEEVEYYKNRLIGEIGNYKFESNTMEQYKKDILGNYEFFKSDNYHLEEGIDYYNPMFGILWYKWNNGEGSISEPEVITFYSKKERKKWLKENRPVILYLGWSKYRDNSKCPHSRIFENTKYLDWCIENMDKNPEIFLYRVRYHLGPALPWWKYQLQFLIKKLCFDKKMYWWFHKFYSVK
jgi:hypothetical protein